MLLDLIDDPVMVIDACGCIAYCNAATDAWLASDTGLAVGRGLDRRWRLCDAALLTAVRQVVGVKGSGRARPRVVVVPSRSRGARLVMQVRRCPAARGLSGAHAMVRVHDPRAVRAEPLDASVIRESFGLTAVEADVALSLTQGLSPAAISMQRGVSRTTTAFHLRNLFSKTGTRRQSELVRMLLSHGVGCPSRD